MKKNLLFIVLAFVLTLSVSVLAATPAYKDGTYVGFAPDAKGNYIVEVVIQFGKIADVNIITPFKPANYKSEASKWLFREYPIMVTTTQKAEIDVVAGATSSSNHLAAATQMALDIAAGAYKGNTYYGVSKNYQHGHTVLKVTVENKKVTNVEFLTWQQDNDGFLMKAKDEKYPHKAAVEFFKSFPKLAVKAQANIDDIDGVTGATHSYDEWTYAYKMALKQAGLLD